MTTTDIDNLRQLAEHYRAAFAANADSHAGFTEVAAIWAEAMTPSDLLALLDALRAVQAERDGLREVAARVGNALLDWLHDFKYLAVTDLCVALDSVGVELAWRQEDDHEA